MHHRPIPPPSLWSRVRSRPLWAPLLLACVVAAVALTAAVGGGRLPGLSDASSTTDAPRAEAAAPPSTAAVPTSSSAAPTVVVPPTTEVAPTPAPVATTTEATPPPAAPEPEAEPEPEETTPAPAPAPAPAPVPAPAPPVAAAAPAPGPEGAVLALVNTERAAAGCPAVRADEALAAVARAHSADMRDRGFFSHVNPEGLDPFARARAAGVGNARAENIAYGQPDAAAVMTAWMNSSGHRRNILDCSLRTLGVGVAQGAGGPWWTQLFGS